MGNRYFIAVGISDAVRDTLRRRVTEHPAFAIVLDLPGLIGAVELGASIISLDDASVIIGSLRTSGRRESLSSISPDVASLILDSRGEHGPNSVVEIEFAPHGLSNLV